MCMSMLSIPTVPARPTETGQPSADLHHSPQSAFQPRHTSSCPNAARATLPHPTHRRRYHAGARGTLHWFTTELARLRPDHQSLQKPRSEAGPAPPAQALPCRAATAPRPPASNCCGGPEPERPTRTPPTARRPETRHRQRGPAAAGGPGDAGDWHAQPKGSLLLRPSAGPSPYLSMVCGRAKPVCSDMAPARRSGPSRGPGA